MSNPNPFDPQSDYQAPKGDSKYLKFEKGETEFLPLQSPVIGYQYWNIENKPVRLKEQPANPALLPGIRAEDDGRFKVSHFWAFPVIDVADGKVKILEITQKGIQGDIRAYAQNKKWGNPVMRYTFTINREGDKLDTTYTVMANPLPEVPAEWGKAWDEIRDFGFDLNELFDNGDPFAPKNKPVDPTEPVYEAEEAQPVD